LQPDLRLSLSAGIDWPIDDMRRWPARYESPGEWPRDEPQLTARVGPDGSCWFRYHDGAEFLIDGRGRHISARWGHGLTDADAAVYLLGPVLGFALRLRGRVPLHASAVAVEGKARLFVGDAGAGKSTTAAACANLGYRILSDDIVTVVDVGGSFVAYPAHPRITMWPDSAVGLFDAAELLPTLSPTYDKRYLDLEPGLTFQQTPLPVEVIYVLDERSAEDDRLLVRGLEPRVALLSLVSNTYVNYLIDRPMRAREFSLLSLMAERIPVSLVQLGRSMAVLPESCARLMAQRPRGRVT
jgi:hypothetical protein